MKIVKQSGDVVVFDKQKLRASLEVSGADAVQVNEVMEAVIKQLYEGMSTKKIYRLAFQLLKKKCKSTAARYNLKAAIQALGPAGFFFEKFMAKLFERDGFQTLANVILQGKSVSHEIDILLLKQNKVRMVECKFHSNVDTKSDVKIPMYILSRYNDLTDLNYKIFNQTHAISSVCIVTNTHFTTDAIKFSSDYNLQLLGWDYPQNFGIKNKIDTHKLYPITCLTTLTGMEKEKLLILNLILAKDVIERTESLYQIGIHTSRIKNIVKEASELSGYLFNKKV